MALSLSTPTPVDADAHGENDDLLAHRLARLAGRVLTGFGLIAAGLIFWRSPGSELLASLELLLAATGTAAMLLDARGHHRAGATLLLWGTWLVAVAMTPYTGGLYGPSLSNYPLLIIFCSWVLGSRATLWMIGLTTLVLIVDLWFFPAHQVQPAFYSNRWLMGAYLLVVLLLSGLLALSSRRSYQLRFERERRIAADLAAREVELRKLTLVVEQSPESILVTDLQANIEYVNEALVRNSGYSREELLGRNARLLDTSRTPPETFKAMWAALRAGENWQGEFISQRKNGSEYAESVLAAPLRRPDGEITHFVALKQDITDQRRAEAHIRQLAYHDTLTGLPNRAHLIERLALALHPATPGAAPRLGALLLFNLDRFKNVNEARGQDFGDALLMAVTARLTRLLRDGDLLARVAADEFGVLLQGLGPDASSASHQALALSERIRTDLQQALLVSPGESVTVTASMGVALYPSGPQDAPTEVLRRAVTALHQAKADGGGQAAFFESGMAESAQQRFRIERELRQAIPAGELRLYLQPQVNARRECVGAEVLVRWLHPRQGLVPPGVFIPVAEESDLIVQLGRWVFNEACRLQASETMAGRPLRLSMNLSPRHFRQPDFVAWFKTLLADTGADPTQLTLEMTESMVIDNLDQAVARMNEISALGVHFSVDDFGTGYSSLAYLKRLPIDELKIDKSFVQDAPRHADDAALVETILAVARHMRLQVVAEGVESEAQASFLAEHGEGVVYQGYLFGRPEPAETWLARWRGEAG